MAKEHKDQAWLMHISSYLPQGSGLAEEHILKYEHQPLGMNVFFL
jgi:hypothetical protein